MRRMFRNQTANASQIPIVRNYQDQAAFRWPRQSLILTGATTAVARSDKDCVSVTDIELLSSDHTVSP